MQTFSIGVIGRKPAVSANTIKYMALVAMLIDHVGYLFLWELYLQASVVNGVHTMGDAVPPEAKTWYMLYWAARVIGRIVFPVFAFLLVQGFLLTSNRKKYAGRLFLFALLSEVPYDLAFHRVWFDWPLQNIIWSLLIGFLMLCGLQWAEKSPPARRTLQMVGVVLLALVIEVVLGASGGVGGILLIAAFYVFRERPRWQILGVLLALLYMSVEFMWIQIFGMAVFLPLSYYNGKRGSGSKYIFYWFYPLHLLLLAGIAFVLFPS